MDDHDSGEGLDRQPAPVSVVVPVRNGGDDLVACLEGLKGSTLQDFELIVVDDGSTDDSAQIAERFGARVIRNERPLGPAASRNAGAEASRSPLVFFIDADVVVHADAIEKLVSRFERDPGIAALFGSYDDQPTAPGTVSAFRNLLHHYVHQKGSFEDSARPAHTFWTGCGAIRRHVFLSLGGFDPRLYRRPAIEDIELGYRITRAGLRIELVRDILVTHRKRWTLWSMIRTDVLHRGVPWMLLLMWSNTRENDLNIRSSQKLSVLLTGVAIVASIAAPWVAPVFTASVIATCLIFIFAINQEFYGFLMARRGVEFAAQGFFLHLVYFVCCGISVALALILRALLTRATSVTAVLRPSERFDSRSFPRPPIKTRSTSRWVRR